MAAGREERPVFPPPARGVGCGVAMRQACGLRDAKNTWTLDGPGNGPASGKNHVQQDRTHSPANEIADVEGDDGHVSGDLAGNMTKIPLMAEDRTVIGHRTLRFDAWNRLAKVQAGASTQAWTASA